MIIFQEYENYLVIERYKNIHIISSFHHNGLKTGYFTNKIIKFVRDNGPLVYNVFYDDLFQYDIRIISRNYNIETKSKSINDQDYKILDYQENFDDSCYRLIMEKTKIYNGERI